ncbi:MAG: hypothetical protein H7Z73_04595 [Candidatus Saccharibacteria bacterium]|nr:hypothetical protein [Moraxellaceae bacterium]
MKKQAFFIALFFLSNIASAEITSQTLCFSKQNSKKVELVMRKYFDEEIQREIGALVKYSTSKDPIQLVFIGDEITEESVDYELHWLEIFNGKINGEYRLLKPKMSTVLGAYVKYKNFKTGKEAIFSPSGKTSDECVIK